MRIFLSYASEQKAAAEAVAFSLRSRGHSVFLDRDDLPEGNSYDDRIANGVDRSDMMIFLISPQSIAAGRYSLTELRFARYKWPNPNGRVLPVVIEPAPMADIPPYLKAVGILEPQGNSAAEIAFAVERLRGLERALNVGVIAALPGFVAAVIGGLLPVEVLSKSLIVMRGVLKQDVALENGLVLALLFGGLYWWLGDRKWWKVLFVGVAGFVAWVSCLFVFYDLGPSLSVFKSPPNAQFKEIVSALPDPIGIELKTAIDAVERYISLAGDNASRLSFAFALSVSGLACFLPVFIGFALVDRSMRSLTRLAIGCLFAITAAAAGYFLADASLPLKDFSLGKIFWFFERSDLWFVLLYLPWLMLVPASLAYWMVRGRE
jgi:hypothetical protein